MIGIFPFWFRFHTGDFFYFDPVQVERVVGDLEEARAVSVEDDMNLSALNLGMIAAYYYLQYTTIELFANSVTAKTKLRSL